MKIKAAIPLIHHLILLVKVKFSKVKIKFQGSRFRVSPWGVLPVIACERGGAGSISSKGSKGVSAAHKKSEAPRSINRAMPEGQGVTGFPFMVS